MAEPGLGTCKSSHLELGTYLVTVTIQNCISWLEWHTANAPESISGLVQKKKPAFSKGGTMKVLQGNELYLMSYFCCLLVSPASAFHLCALGSS